MGGGGGDSKENQQILGFSVTVKKSKVLRQRPPKVLYCHKKQFRILWAVAAVIPRTTNKY